MLWMMVWFRTWSSLCAAQDLAVVWPPSQPMQHDCAWRAVFSCGAPINEVERGPGNYLLPVLIPSQHDWIPGKEDTIIDGPGEVL